MDAHALSRRSLFAAAGVLWAAPDDEASIRALFDELTATWNRLDLAAYAAAFEDDAIMITPDAMFLRGRAEIERAVGALRRGLLKNSRVSTTVAEVRRIKPDVALAIGTGEDDTGILGPDGQKLPPGHARFVSVLVKKGGGWKLASYQLTLIPEKR